MKVNTTPIFTIVSPASPIFDVSSFAPMDPNQDKVDTTLKGNESNPAQTVAEGKGKGKAIDIAPQDVSMGEDDSSSDEETGAEDEVRNDTRQFLHLNGLSN